MKEKLKYGIGDHAYVIKTGRKVVVLSASQYSSGTYFGVADAELPAKELGALKVGDLNWIAEKKLGTENEAGEEWQIRKDEEEERARAKAQAKENANAKTDKRKPRIVVVKDGVASFMDLGVDMGKAEESGGIDISDGDPIEGGTEGSGE